MGPASSRVLLMLEGRKDFILGLKRGRFIVEVALSDWMYRQKPQEWHFRRPWTRSAHHGASNLCLGWQKYVVVAKNKNNSSNQIVLAF